MESGVYLIYNAINMKIYVGSTHNFQKRFKGHVNYCKHNKNSKHLQNAWNKYGEQNFKFVVLECVEPIKTKLLEREQYWIDTLQPEYNILKYTTSTLGYRHDEETKQRISKKQKGKQYSLGFKHTAETCAKRSKASMGNKGNTGGTISEQHKQAIIKANTGRKHSPETKAKIAEKTRLQHIRQNEAKKLLKP